VPLVVDCPNFFFCCHFHIKFYGQRVIIVPMVLVILVATRGVQIMIDRLMRPKENEWENLLAHSLCEEEARPCT